MKRNLFIALLVLLSGCDTKQDLDPEIALVEAFEVLFDQETHVVVLADKPTQLGSSPNILVSDQKPMTVLGESSSLCLALRGGVSLQNTETMDRLFAEAMGNAKVTVDLTLSDGTRIPLGMPLQAWSLRGNVLKKNELSACARARCKVDLPVGSQVSQVSISSDAPLSVQGIYWTSRADLQQPPPKSKQVADSPVPKTPSRCSR